MIGVNLINFISQFLIFFSAKDFEALETFCNSEKWEWAYLHLHVKYDPVPIYNDLYSRSVQG